MRDVCFSQNTSALLHQACFISCRDDITPMCRPAVKALQLEAASQLHRYQLHFIMQNRHRLDAIGLTAVASLQLLACKDEADAVLRPCNFSCICFIQAVNRNILLHPDRNGLARKCLHKHLHHICLLQHTSKCLTELKRTVEEQYSNISGGAAISCLATRDTCGLVPITIDHLRY